MSTWRQKAIAIAPELKNDFQAPDLSPYTVFMELLNILKQAYINNETERIQRIYEYAEWCHRQKDQKLWNAAGVSFYEHLADNDLMFSQFTKWIRKDIYLAIRDLLNQRIDEKKMTYLDHFYGWKRKEA